MYLIVGLGNPGKEYALTRHNVGFLFVDWLVARAPLGRGRSDKFTQSNEGGKSSGGVARSAGGLSIGGFEAWKKGYQGLYTTGTFNSEKTILLKPETFMNLSGKSVQACATFFKIHPKNIMIISDDIDMEFGKVRFRETGSQGGHNGIGSILQTFGTNDIKRIKIGIGRHPNMDAADWVLSKFAKEEKEKLEEIFEEVVEKLLEKLS